MPIPQGLTVSFVSAEEMRAFVERWVINSYTDEEATVDREFLLLLDFINERHNVKDMIVARYSGNVIGFYDREDKELLVLSRGNQDLHPDEKWVFAHEIIHALQDHAFDLNSLYPDKWLREDDLLAKKALVEGDARHFDRRYREEVLTEEERDLLGTSRTGGSRPAVRPTRFFLWFGIFPYDQGSFFVSQLERYGGLQALDEAYSNPPQSTEQILHPGKYRSGEAPVQVSIPNFLDTLGPSWQLFDTGVIGEFIMKLHLENQLNYTEASSAAAGWSGDAYALGMDTATGESALVSLSAWDSTEDAQQFFRSYEKYAVEAGGQLASSQESAMVWTRSGRSVHLEIEGDRVLLIIGSSQSTVEAISQVVRP